MNSAEAAQVGQRGRASVEHAQEGLIGSLGVW